MADGKFARKVTQVKTVYNGSPCKFSIIHGSPITLKNLKLQPTLLETSFNRLS